MTRNVQFQLNAAWNGLCDHVGKTKARLDEAMSDAVDFQESVQRMFDLLNEECEKVDKMEPVATELEIVKAQVDELKVF